MRGEILKKLKNIQLILKSWLTHFDSVPQCRFDRLHQRLLSQDLKNGRLLVGSGGGKVSSGLRHGCPTISIWQLMAIYATLYNNGLNNKPCFFKFCLIQSNINVYCSGWFHFFCDSEPLLTLMEANKAACAYIKRQRIKVEMQLLSF